MDHALRTALFSRPVDPVGAILRKYGALAASALYIPDFNPNRVAASGLGRMYQESGGTTAVVIVADPFGLVIGEDQGASLGSELNSNPNFDADVTGWQLAGGATLAWDATGAALIDITGGSGGMRDTQTLALTVGGLYRIRVVLKVGTYDGSLILRAGAVTLKTITPTVDYAEHTAYFVAAAADPLIDLIRSTANTGTVLVDTLSIVRVAGKHAHQATAGSRGTLRQGNSNNRYCWRGDGTDDNLLSTLSPAAAWYMGAAVEFDAVSDKCMGASVSTNLISLGTDSNGLATAYVGSTVQAISAADVRDIPGVIWVSASGATFDAGWKPFNGPAEIVTGIAFAGAIPTTQPIRLGAENDDGAAVAFHAGDAYAYLSIQARLTAAEQLAVADRFSRV